MIDPASFERVADHLVLNRALQKIWMLLLFPLPSPTFTRGLDLRLLDVDKPV